MMEETKQPRTTHCTSRRLVTLRQPGRPQVPARRVVGEPSAEGKKKAKAWTDAAAAMIKLGVPQSRVDHLVKQGNPALVAELVKELEGKK